MAQHAPNLVDGSTLALICGVSSSTIPHWRRSGMPVHQEGSRGKAWQYDTAQVIRWLIDRQTGEEAQQLDLARERARLAHHQANVTALNEGLLAGEIVKTEDVLQAWQAMIGAARAKLLILGGKLVTQIIDEQDTQKAKETADRHIREILGELEGTGLPAALDRALEAGVPSVAPAAKAQSR